MLSIVEMWVIFVEALGFFVVDRKLLIYYTILVLAIVMLYFFYN